MPPFQTAALAFIALWLMAVAVRYRKSTPVLVGGLAVTGLAALFALLSGITNLDALGLAPPRSWPVTITVAIGGLAIMLAYSPLADRIATRLVEKPPTLGAFRALQQSRPKLLLGILVAWALGGILEELAFRGIVLQTVETMFAQLLGRSPATGVAVAAAAAGAGVIHLYQGPRAVIIIVQLSVLFGLVFVAAGHNLWAVILCHGLYDTIAFVRFAMGKSRYARKESERPPAPG